MKKIIATILVFALAFSFTACGSKSPSTNSAQQDGATVVKVKNYSEKEVIAAADELYIQLNEYAQQNDFEGYSGLFVNTDEESIKNLYDNMNPRNDYDQHFTILVCQAEGYYRIGHTDAVASGNYPNTNVNRAWFHAIVVNTPDGWRYDLSSTAYTALDEVFRETFPQGMQKAITEGRNATTFNNGNYMHLDTGMYIDKIFDATLMTLWQDEAGNLCAGVLFNNGTDDNRTATRITLKIADINLGVVFEGEIGSETVLKGSSKYVVFTIPAGQVKTGTSAWGAMNYNINVQSV